MSDTLPNDQDKHGAQDSASQPAAAPMKAADARPRTEADVLESLRDRVVRAVEEIGRLRAVNVELAARIAQLQGVEANKIRLELDDDPEVLHEKISGFIRAIDQYLEDYDGAAPTSG